MEISITPISLNIDDSVEKIISSQQKKVDYIDFRTVDEGWCYANLLVSPISEYQNDYDAFVSLLNIQLHFDEEWDLTETNSENARDVLNTLLCRIKNFEVKRISNSKIQEEIDLISNGMQEAILDAKRSGKDKGYEENWGIFLNDKEIKFTDKYLYYVPELSQIVEGISLSLRWNKIELFYKTQLNYHYFAWYTNA